MKNVLLISKTKESVLPLIDVLRKDGYDKFTTVFTSQQALNEVSNHIFDIVVINTPILDSSGIALSIEICKTTRSGVFLIIKSDILDVIKSKVGDHGVFIIPKPINKHYFHHALLFWQVSKTRIEGLAEENIMLKNKVEELNLINRAKFVLMKCLSMSESQAHSYLEKQAMDMRQTKIKIAQQVLTTYET